jgi:hypothetical protein
VLKIFDTVTGNSGLTNNFIGEAAVFDFIQIELIFEALFDYILIGSTQIWCGLAGLSCKRCNQESFPNFLIIGKGQKSDRDQQVTVCFVNHSDGCTVGLWRKEKVITARSAGGVLGNIDHKW